MYCRGARVHSDSWGTADATYDSLAADLDRFAWAYQDFLPVVAAGNFGYREQDSTLTSPAVAKNCIAVGEASSYQDIVIIIIERCSCQSIQHLSADKLQVLSSTMQLSHFSCLLSDVCAPLKGICVVRIGRCKLSGTPLKQSFAMHHLQLHVLVIVSLLVRGVFQLQIALEDGE